MSDEPNNDGARISARRTVSSLAVVGCNVSKNDRITASTAEFPDTLVESLGDVSANARGRGDVEEKIANWWNDIAEWLGPATT